MLLLAYQHSVICSSKKRSREKTSEKIQPKPNFTGQFMPKSLKEFDWCHMHLQC